ncbi:MAG: HAMP domain-containing protein [Gemmatimonadaceae bacterium]|nr:HAMP domain-containing protein [Gemmatimonadaceae bacterium]MCW5825701.1 HAMP domain-containing protein [Gemmatimonadaceae bacterium]
MRLTQRLLLGALIVVGFLAALIITIVDRQLTARLEEDATTFLEREARLAGVLWLRDAGAPDSIADATGSALGRRVTLVDTAGVVVGDSEFNDDALRGLQNHASRPEVAAAVRDGRGSARRASPSTGEQELYVAVHVPPLGVARVSLPTASIDAVTSDARRDVIGASLLALAAALGIAFLFSRSVSRPVEELRDVAQALADGDLARRPTLKAPGEVGELAATLKELAEQLSARLRALEADETLLVQLTESLNEGVIAVDHGRMIVRINETARRLLGTRAPIPFPTDELPRDVALRDALQDAFAGETTEGVEIVIAGRTLNITARPLTGGGAVLALFDLTRVRRLEAVRRDFVANVSHELRTPLTIVGGFAETLVGEDDLPAEMRKGFAERILGNTRRMQRIVDDLLDLSRIESGGWVPNPQRVDVTAMAQDVFSAARDAATAKGLELRAEVAAEASSVYADPTALRQILGNLVDNAVRHTASGSVVLFTEPHERGVVLGVRDTGVGIPLEHLPRIFERFYRVDPGRAREEGGTGLGLAIVKHLVEAHGGRVKASSEVARGSSITALFPHAPG